MKNYLFDLYGTLVDVRTDENSKKFKRKYSNYFRKINPDIDFWRSYERECKSLAKGDEYSEVDLFGVFKAILPESDENSLKEVAYTFRKYSRSRLRVYKGARKTLLKLKESGAKIYLLSNAQACFTLPELEKLNLLNLFDGVELSSDFVRKKPCKEFFAHAVNKYGLDIKQSIYCGNDLKSDILGAKSVSLSTAYVKTAISPADDDLEKIKRISDFATDDYKKFLNYLLETAEF